MKRKFTVYPVITCVWMRKDDDGNVQPIAGLSVSEDGIRMSDSSDYSPMRHNEASHVATRNAKILGEEWQNKLLMTYEVDAEDF